MNLKTHIIYRCLIVVSVVATAFLAYRYGASSKDGEISMLRRQVAEGELVRQEAVIDRAVSQQMEDIAYQQKAISDEHLVQARKNALLAEENARESEANALRAEEERRLALRAKEEADVQRGVADVKRREAEAAKTNAQKALEQTRRMSYNQLGVQLGATAHNQVAEQDGGRELSSLLSLWSYIFLKRTGGNTYSSDTYMALSRNSGTERTYFSPSHGEIRSVCMGRNGCVVMATSYGEVAVIDGDMVRKLLVHDSRDFDFRKVMVRGDVIVLLSREGKMLFVDDRDGSICSVLDLTDADGRSAKGVARQRTERGDEVFSHMAELGDYVFAGSRRAIFRVDVADPRRHNKVLTEIAVPADISCMYAMDDVVRVHLDNGKCMELDAKGAYRMIPPPQQRGVVTAGCYDSETGLTMLGRKDGICEILNRYGRHVTYVSCHGARVSSVAVVDTIGIICSYDHGVQICNMPMFKMDSGYSFRQELDFESEPPVYGESTGGWITPVQLSYKGWPLCVVADEKSKFAYIGMSDGQLSRLQTSTQRLAQIVRSRISKDLTHDQWERYIGATSIFPYETLKDAQ